MQKFTVIRLLFLLILFNLKVISGLQKENKENLINLAEENYGPNSNSSLRKDEENFLLEKNINVIVKRETKGVKNTLLATGTTKNRRQAQSEPNIQNYNKDTLPLCPPGLTYYQDYADEIVCYVITEPTPFPPPCPYPTTLEYFFIAWHIQVTDQLHWAFTNKNVSEVGKKNCLLKNGTSGSDFIPTSCSNKYPGVCVYPYKSTFRNGVVSIPTFNDYCRKRYGNSCISDDFKTIPTCYCKREVQIKEQPRNKFCKNLVEIKDAYVNNLLIRLLSGNESCWISLHKEGPKVNFSDKISYRWSTTNTMGDYTFWSKDMDATKKYGALRRDGWLLEEDGVLNCAICEMENESHNEVHIKIKYKKSLLEVEIQNTIEVFQNVTCFSPHPDEYQTIDLRNNNEHYLVIDLEFPFAVSGYYWCEALQIANLTRVFSNTIFIASTYGHEYAVLITTPEEGDESYYKPRASDIVACNKIQQQFRQFSYFTSIPVKTIAYKEKEGTIQVLCHIHINSHDILIAEELEFLSQTLKNSTLKTTNLTSLEVCLPEVTKSGSHVLEWPQTRIGSTIIPQELCLQENGSPVTRTCSGDFYYGAYWLEVNGACANITYSERTHLLDDLLKSDTITPNNLSTALLNITQDTNNITSYDIHLISKSLEKLAEFNENLNITDVAMTINNVMHFNPQKLKDSQEILNSTDIILQSLDEMLERTETNRYISEVTEKLVVQISDLNKTNINGIQLEKAQNGFDPEKVIPIQKGIFGEDLMNEKVELAMIIPQPLHDDILKCVGPKSSAKLITTVFYDDVLFNEATNSHNRPDGRVISVTIPNFNCPFNESLQVIFSASNYKNVKCASWNYGLNDFMESTHGHWLVEGDPKNFGNSTYQFCEFKHVTHFTLLVMGDFNEISMEQSKALDVTTAIGSGLSILGLTMIFLTAIMFKSFNSTDSVILLNFSIAITAKIILLFLADNLGKTKILCIIFGAALHYIVLSQFCWMLTIAIFQYKRYVVVYKSAISNLVAKLCLISWGIPLIPVIIIILISQENYGKNSHGLCYALGNYFIFGVLAPVALIIFINLIVFILIIIGITSNRPDKVHQKTDKTLILQIKLAILLFFLLGLTWGFGLLASINGGIIFSYLFCITATLQGFVLFFYFIVLNEKTRSLWTKLCCKGGKDTEPQKKNLRRNPQHSNVDTNLNTTKLLRWQEDADDIDN